MARRLHSVWRAPRKSSGSLGYARLDKKKKNTNSSSSSLDLFGGAVYFSIAYNPRQYLYPARPKGNVIIRSQHPPETATWIFQRHFLSAKHLASFPSTVPCAQIRPSHGSFPAVRDAAPLASPVGGAKETIAGTLVATRVSATPPASVRDTQPRITLRADRGEDGAGNVNR